MPKKTDINFQSKVFRLKIAGFSFDEIARLLGLKSRQLARYHFLKMTDIITRVKNIKGRR